MRGPRLVTGRRAITTGRAAGLYRTAPLPAREESGVTVNPFRDVPARRS